MCACIHTNTQIYTNTYTHTQIVFNTWYVVVKSWRTNSYRLWRQIFCRFFASQLFSRHSPVRCDHDAARWDLLLCDMSAHLLWEARRRDSLSYLSNHPFAIARCSSSVSDTTSSCLMDRACPRSDMGDERTVRTRANLLQAQLEDRLENLTQKRNQSKALHNSVRQKPPCSTFNQPARSAWGYWVKEWLQGCRSGPRTPRWRPGYWRLVCPFLCLPHLTAARPMPRPPSSALMRSLAGPENRTCEANAKIRLATFTHGGRNEVKH